MSDVLLALNRRDEALAAQQDALATFQALAAADPTNATGRNDIAISESKIGEILDGGGRSSEAVKSYERALSIHQALAASDPGNDSMTLEVASDQNRLATAQAKLGAREASLANHTSAVAATRALREANAGNVELTVALALALGGRADARLTFARKQPFPPTRAEDLAAAERDYTESVALLTALQGSRHHPGDGPDDARESPERAGAHPVRAVRDDLPALNSLEDALRRPRRQRCVDAESQIADRSFRMNTHAIGRPDMSCDSPRATSSNPLAL